MSGNRGFKGGYRILGYALRLWKLTLSRSTRVRAATDTPRCQLCAATPMGRNMKRTYLSWYYWRYRRSDDETG